MNILDNKIKELSLEAEELVKHRSKLEEELTRVDMRLTHIVGAIGELKKLKEETQDDSTSKDN